MKIHEVYDNLPIPGYALSYLVNGDDSGLDENDKKDIDDYMKDYYTRADSVNGHVVFSVDSEEGYFDSCPEFGLACDVYDCTIAILV